MFLRFIRVVILSVVQSCLLIGNIQLCEHTRLFINLPINGYLGCFQFGAIINNAAKNIHVWVF